MAKVMFNPIERMKDFLEDKNYIIVNGIVHEYSDGIYSTIEDDIVTYNIQEYLAEHSCRIDKAREIFSTLKGYLKRNGHKLNDNPYLINTKNGIVDIDSNKLIPHSPEYPFLYRINASHDKNAKCPKFIKFLQDIIVDEEGHTDEEIIHLLKMFIGYCLFPKITHQKALILYGQGHNGKSVLTFILKELFAGCSSTVNLEDVGIDKFATSDLVGSLLNISPETSSKSKFEKSEIKAIIAGDTIRVQRKNQKAFDYTPFAKHIITSNNLPETSDKTHAFFKRFEVIPFNMTFIDSKDKDLMMDLIKRNKPFKHGEPDLELREGLKRELDGIFMWAIEGLKELLFEENFPVLSQTKETKKIFEAKSNPVEIFAKLYFKYKKNSSIKTTISRKKFIEFCQKNKIHPIGRNKFYDCLERLGYKIDEGYANANYIYDVELKSDKIIPKYVFDEKDFEFFD